MGPRWTRGLGLQVPPGPVDRLGLQPPPRIRRPREAPVRAWTRVHDQPSLGTRRVLPRAERMRLMRSGVLHLLAWLWRPFLFGTAGALVLLAIQVEAGLPHPWLAAAA